MFIYLSKHREWHTNEFDGKAIFYAYFIYHAITYIRGFFNIDWRPDWINMVSGLLFLSFLVPYWLYMPNTNNLKLLWRSFLIWGIPIGCIIFFFLPYDIGIMSVVNFVDVFILCIPFIKKKYSILFLAVALMAVSYDIDRRSILINAIVPILIVLFWRFLKNDLVRKVLISALIISPLFFLFMGITHTFNIFESMNGLDILSTGARNMTVDSRTGIFVDVFSGIEKEGAYLFGLGGNGKVNTSLVFNVNHDYNLIYKYGRTTSESGILNFIQQGGLMGFVVYSLLLIFAVMKANRSQNTFMKMLSVFIAFEYLYSFVQVPLKTNGTTFYLMLWIGMCYNKSFRNMTNPQMKEYLRTIFK
jgi:hypothetical protein